MDGEEIKEPNRRQVMLGAAAGLGALLIAGKKVMAAGPTSPDEKLEQVRTILKDTLKEFLNTYDDSLKGGAQWGKVFPKLFEDMRMYTNAPQVPLGEDRFLKDFARQPGRSDEEKVRRKAVDVILSYQAALLSIGSDSTVKYDSINKEILSRMAKILSDAKKKLGS